MGCDRVDEGLTVDGIRKVGHAVRADALGEPEGRRLLLGLRLQLNPGGSRALHALTAFVNTGVLCSATRFANASMVSLPDVPGPGSG